MGYLDNNGVIFLWTKIKDSFVAKENGKGLSTNDYTTDEKNKLFGIASGANKTVVTDNLNSNSSTNALSAKQGAILDEKISNVPRGDMKTSDYDKDGDSVIDKAKDADTVGGFSVGCDVPSNAVFTDTVYTHPTYEVHTGYPTEGQKPSFGGTFSVSQVKMDSNGHVTGLTKRTVTIPSAAASASANGLMTSSMYTKLNALPSNSKLESTYAKKTDISGVYKYKGSVASASALPTSGQTTGDVYNIEAASSYGAAGANVAWDGTKWDALGEIFSITSITNAELDTICVLTDE